MIRPNVGPISTKKTNPPYFAPHFDYVLNAYTGFLARINMNELDLEDQGHQMLLPLLLPASSHTGLIMCH